MKNAEKLIVELKDIFEIAEHEEVIKLSEVKKGTGLKIALIVVSILFVISLIANLYFYTRQYAPDSGLENQIANLQSQLDSLNTTYQSYVSTHSHSNSEYSSLENQIANLESQIESLKSAKLINVNLFGTDNRPLFQTPYLHVTGEVVNVGTYTAYNCKLHVILYQGEVVAEDTYINLGTINGEGWKTVDSNIYYEGSALTAYSIYAEWD